MFNPQGNGPYIKTPWFRKVKSSFHAHKRVTVTAGFMVFSLILIFLSYGDFSLIHSLRTETTELLSPAVEVARAPGTLLKTVYQHIEGFIDQKDTILQLQHNNQKLKETALWAQQVHKENLELRTILKIPQDKYKIVAHARVLSYPGTPYVKSILLGVGTKQGVAPLQAVMTPYGLVGRVTDVGETSARVILITDLNAQVPVMIKPGNVHAILTGNNTEVPRLKYIQDAYGAIAVGDKVETSASGGVFSPGIPVGTVQKIEGEHILIKPAVDIENLTFVTIIKTNEISEVLGGES